MSIDYILLLRNLKSTTHIKHIEKLRKAAFKHVDKFKQETSTSRMDAMLVSSVQSSPHGSKELQDSELTQAMQVEISNHTVVLLQIFSRKLKSL